jgi:hypothetical protein
MKGRFRFLTLAMAMIAALLLVFGRPVPVYADTFVVNTTDDNDDGKCD